ncbi:MAG: nucleoside deaminase [Firmicutes bacterium]|nr:nucleoside deaminase [Bacillota bacterium]
MGMVEQKDEAYMRRALELAHDAAIIGEVPVGALIVKAGTIIAAANNRRELLNDPTAHAELLAIRAAAQKLGSWRLPGTTLYVTLEPCAMCAGAMVLARIERLVYGAADPKSGAVRSLYRLADDQRLNHRLEITAGVLSADCSQLLKEFFEQRRDNK